MNYLMLIDDLRSVPRILPRILLLVKMLMKVPRNGRKRDSGWRSTCFENLVVPVEKICL